MALDSGGYVYKKYHDGLWQKSNKSYDIPPYLLTKLICDEKQNTAAAAGKNGVPDEIQIPSKWDIVWITYLYQYARKDEGSVNQFVDGLRKSGMDACQDV